MNKLGIVVAVVCFYLFCAFGVGAQQAVKQEIKVEYLKTPRPMALHFSDAARVENILYLSGDRGVDLQHHEGCARGH